jgi:hypothetical protein
MRRLAVWLEPTVSALAGACVVVLAQPCACAGAAEPPGVSRAGPQDNGWAHATAARSG